MSNAAALTVQHESQRRRQPTREDKKNTHSNVIQCLSVLQLVEPLEMALTALDAQHIIIIIIKKYALR